MALTRTPSRRLAAQLLIAAALAASPALAAEHEKGMSSGQAKSGGSSDMQRKMNEDMKEMAAMKLSGDMDHDFATMMRRHHQSGIEMAQMQLKAGKDAELKKIAQQIMDGQKKEIEALDRWLERHKAPQR